MRLISELWKDIGVFKGMDYHGRYMVSSKGRVFDTKRNILMPMYLTRGYWNIDLGSRKTKRHAPIHRLVAIAFIPNPDNLPQVNHKDENKQNNDVNNLEWCTAEYNVNYGTARERATETRRKNLTEQGFTIKPYKKKKIFYAKIAVVQMDLNCNPVKIWDTPSDINSNQYNLRSIYKCLRENGHRHKNYKWIYLYKYIEEFGEIDIQKYRDVNPDSIVVKQKEKKPTSKPIVQLSLDMQFIKEWKSAYIAAQFVGVDRRSIVACLRKGIDYTSGGFKWMYLEDYKKLNSNY